MNKKYGRLVVDLKSKLDEVIKLKSFKNYKTEKLDEFLELEDSINLDKKRLMNYFLILDYEVNNREYKIAKLTIRINKQLTLKSNNYYKEIKKEIKDLTLEINNINNQIDEFSSNGHSVVYLKYKLKEADKKLNSANKQLAKKQKNFNKETIDIDKFKEKILTLGSEVQEYKTIINELLDLFNRTTDELKFIHSDLLFDDEVTFNIKNLSLWYGKQQALDNVELKIKQNKVTAIIGPSGCGKSTLLKTLNRIIDTDDNVKMTGEIIYENKYKLSDLSSITNKYDKLDISTLRGKVGMIFQTPNPFHFSIERNVQYGPRSKGIDDNSYLTKLTKEKLIDVGLWEEVKDNLKIYGTSLSGGQQQRLCIARALANEPRTLLMDEPTSSLDPYSSHKIEELIMKLKDHYTIIIVTHSLQQARRIADEVVFLYEGKIIEQGSCKQIFEKPRYSKTKEYILGNFG